MPLEQEHAYGLELIYNHYDAHGIADIISFTIWDNKIRRDLLFSRERPFRVNTLYSKYFTVYDCVSKIMSYFFVNTSELDFRRENSTMGMWSIEGMDFEYSVMPSDITHLGRKTINLLKHRSSTYGSVVSSSYLLIELPEIVQFIDPAYYFQFAMSTLRVTSIDLGISQFPIVGSVSVLGIAKSFKMYELTAINPVSTDRVKLNFD